MIHRDTAPSFDHVVGTYLNPKLGSWDPLDTNFPVGAMVVPINSPVTVSCHAKSVNIKGRFSS